LPNFKMLLDWCESYTIEIRSKLKFNSTNSNKIAQMMKEKWFVNVSIIQSDKKWQKAHRKVK